MHGSPMLAWHWEPAVAQGGRVMVGSGRHWACSRSGALPQPLGQQAVKPIPAAFAWHSVFLPKKPYCWMDCGCSALSLALTYALWAARRGWDLGVSSRPGLVERWQLSCCWRGTGRVERGHEPGLSSAFPSLLCCLTPCPSS